MRRNLHSLCTKPLALHVSNLQAYSCTDGLWSSVGRNRPVGQARPGQALPRAASRHTLTRHDALNASYAYPVVRFRACPAPCPLLWRRILIYVTCILASLACFVSLRTLVSALPGDAGLSFVEGNAEALPFDDASFDSYTIAFGIRNVTDRPAALREALRVLKPGGRCALGGGRGRGASKEGGVWEVLPRWVHGLTRKAAAARPLQQHLDSLLDAALAIVTRLNLTSLHLFCMHNVFRIWNQ